MPSGDNHLVVNLIMIELMGTIFFLAILTICIYIKRYFVRKPLDGFTALITNGDTNLSQELAEQLSSKHNCHVILVKGRQTQNGVTQTDFIAPQSAGISVLHCDILNNEDLEQLAETIQSTFDGIDIVIDSAMKDVFSTTKSEDCRAFIDATSQKLRATINMLMHFIPKMKYSKCGHFVTIQPIIKNKKPLYPYGDIRSFINLILTDNQSTYVMDLFNRQKIQLTAIMYNYDDLKVNAITCNGHNNNIGSRTSNPEIQLISERILDGIRANRSVMHIKNVNKVNKINLISSFRSYFRRNQTSTINCNGHSKVR